jgi:hypothetical protein
MRHQEARNGMATSDPPVGLPRPTNRAGLPVPYIAASPDQLGETDTTRRLQVARDGLCQVCGLSVGGHGFAVTNTGSDWRWPHEWILDFGLLHEECLRLALRHCPALRAWEDKKLLQLTLADTELTTANQRIVPEARQASLTVDVALYRDPA